MEDLKRLNIENLNIRYLAWRENPDPVMWGKVLVKKASIKESRALDILKGAQPIDEEREALSEGFNINKDELSTARLLELSGEEVLKKNIKYLLNNLPHGERKIMSQALNVSQETISRWSKSGVTNKTRPAKILHYLGLDPTIDLSFEPLFLSFFPVGKFAQKSWIQKRLDAISSSELSKLFPALQKLLNGHENS